MDVIGYAETEVKAALGWAESELSTGARWVSGELCIFGGAFLTQLKLELPAANHAFVSGLQDLVGQVVASVEKEFTGGQLKFDNAVSRVFSIVETAGVAGVKGMLSTTAKETAIQIGATALRAGIFALLAA